MVVADTSKHGSAIIVGPLLGRWYSEQTNKHHVSKSKLSKEFIQIMDLLRCEDLR